MTEQSANNMPEPTGAPEGDDDQLPKEDTLTNRGVDDILDEGYSPPDRPRANHFGETEQEELQGESLDQRLAEEQPEVWEAPDPEARQTDQAGRLEADTAAAQGKDNGTFAQDDGVAGGTPSSEETAVHILDEDEQS